MTDTNFQKIKFAIENNKQIEFKYKNPKKKSELGIRIGNPHAIYISKNKTLYEHKKVDIVQISGDGSNNPELLKQYIFDFIYDVKLLDVNFNKNKYYDSNGERYEKLLINIK